MNNAMTHMVAALTSPPWICAVAISCSVAAIGEEK